MDKTTPAETRVAELHQFFVAEFERNANKNAFQILKEIAVQSNGVTCDVPTASPSVRQGYLKVLYDRARQFHDFEFTLKIIHQMHREDCRDAK